MTDTEYLCEKEELLNEIGLLIKKLEQGHHVECFPKKSMPECPPSEAPPPIEIPHPYLPGVMITNRPRAARQNVKVTVDGRLAEYYEPRDFYYDEPPVRVPPWFRPRYPSVELRGGILYDGCDCWKRNGLQDDCRRWDCGRPECLTKPLPECPAALDPPLTGVRRGNAIVPPYFAKRSHFLPQDEGPLPPSPELDSMIVPPIPNAPANRCPIHYQFLPYCPSTGCTK